MLNPRKRQTNKFNTHALAPRLTDAQLLDMERHYRLLATQR